MLLYQHGMVADLTDKLRALRPDVAEEDQGKLEQQLEELEEELLYVNPKYVKVDPKDLERESLKMLNDIMGFFSEG